MNEHAGPATAMSVLIVGLFTILLHDRQPSQPPSPNPTKPRIASKIVPTESIAKPRPSPSKPIARVSEDPVPSLKQPPKPQAEPEKKTTPAAPTVEIREVAVVKKPLPQAPSKPKVPTNPRSPFTIVQAGETLADVASRIYGRSDAAETLWRANRDQVAMIDSPLAGGTLLRTP
jgi:nucleoid-associated protein YgaU